MKTHDLARALRLAADLLKAGPNVPLEEVRIVSSDDHGSTGEIAVNLSTLASLSRIDRKQWLAFILEYNLPIEVRPRDASRDILGKLLRYLEEDAAARERLKQKASSTIRQGSPELLKALQSLLKE